MKTIVSVFFILTLLLSNFAKAQTDEIAVIPQNKYGNLELGLRSTGSFFNDAGGIGFGLGGQFRIRLLKRLNTEWYLDYFTVNVQNVATRNDLHIGWSVMMYPFNTEKAKGKFTPYIIAGHCFDRAYLYENKFPENSGTKNSSAVQMGLGTSYNLTDNFDFTLTCQYMNHLGGHMHGNISGEGSFRRLTIERSNKLHLEGHVLVTLSMNVRIVDFHKK